MLRVPAPTPRVQIHTVQRRWNAKFGRRGGPRIGRGNQWKGLTVPRWVPTTDMKTRSEEWKRRALRNHFPEVWLKHVNWLPSLEAFDVDPEYSWAYYQQAHRQLLYNHPDDYTTFIDENLVNVELRPAIWVPRCLRAFEDMKQRFGASQRQYSSLIQVYGRARIPSKAEEAFNEIGKKKLPYCKENYITLARAYILSREELGEEAVIEKCRKLYEEAHKKELFLPDYISGITFDIFYTSLKKLGSELDYLDRLELYKQRKLENQNWDAKSLWHNIKPKGRLPREWLLLGHPMNKAEMMYRDWKGVKKGQAYFNQEWPKYGYPNQVRWIEKWQEWRKAGKWTEWKAEDFRDKQWPKAVPS